MLRWEAGIYNVGREVRHVLEYHEGQIEPKGADTHREADIRAHVHVHVQRREARRKRETHRNRKHAQL